MKILRYAGFAEESTFNPDQIPSPAFHVDIASASLDAPSEPNIVYEGGLGRAVRTVRPGFYMPEGDIVYAADVQTLAMMFKWALGGYQFNAGSNGGLDEHVAWGSDEMLLPSFTAFVGKDHFEHVFTGCVINSFSLEIEDGLANVTISVIAAKDHKQTLKAVPDLLLTEAYPLAFHEVMVKMGGSDVSAKAKNLTLTVENNVEGESGQSLGSRFSRRFPAFARETSVELGMWYEDTSMLEKFWGSASGPSEKGSEYEDLEIELDGGEFGNAVITLPRVVLNEVPQQPSGRDEIEQTVVMAAVLGDTSVSGVEKTDIVATVETKANGIGAEGKKTMGGVKASGVTKANKGGNSTGDRKDA